MYYKTDVLAEMAYFPNRPPESAMRVKELHTEEWKLCLKDLSHSSEAFYVLPLEFMDIVERMVPDLCSTWAWWNERRVSEHADRISAVGFWRNNPIHTPLIRTAASSGVSPVNHIYEQAYAGWLITQEKFWADHNHVFSKFTFSSQMPLGGSPRFCYQRPRSEEWRLFLDRWCLSETTAPGLPLPQRVYIGRRARSVAKATQNYDSLYFCPITMPMRLLEEQLRTENSKTTDHLAEWLNLISSKNRASGSIIRKYPRWFFLHHYWQCLMRHAPLFHGKTPALHNALLEFINLKGIARGSIKLDTIEEDFKALRLKLPRKSARTRVA